MRGVCEGVTRLSACLLIRTPVYAYNRSLPINRHTVNQGGGHCFCSHSWALLVSEKGPLNIQ